MNKEYHDNEALKEAKKRTKKRSLLSLHFPGLKIKMKIKMKIKVPRIPVMIKVSGAIKPVSFDVRNSCHTGD